MRLSEIRTNRIVCLLGGGIVLALLFWLVLSLVYAMPGSLVDQHISESAAILENEGDYPYDITSDSAYDNYTVAVMLSNCVTKSGNPFYEALSNSYFKCLEGEPHVYGIEKTLSGEQNAIYPRYWHGYVVLLKPLLVFFNVQEIRIIFQTIILVLSGLAAIFLSRSFKYGLGLGALFLASCGLFTSMKAAADLPLFFSFLVMLLGICMVCFVKKERLLKSVPLYFFVVGAITVYFDFLDTPIITLGVPLCVYLMRLLTEHSKTKSIVIAVILSAVLWVFGYGYLWILKWALASIIVDPNSISNALNAASFRVGASENAASYGTSPLLAIALSIDRLGFVKYIMLASLTFGLCMLAVFIIKGFSGKITISNNTKALSLILIIAALPYLWFLVFSNHTCIHAFTFRDQLVTLFVFLSACWYLSIYTFGEMRAFPKSRMDSR